MGPSRSTQASVLGFIRLVPMPLPWHDRSAKWSRGTCHSRVYGSRSPATISSSKAIIAGS